MGGSLAEEELKEIVAKDGYNHIKCFIETGTYKGETTRMASRTFETVHTIEIMPVLHQSAKLEGYRQGIKNIVYHLGDSIEILPKIIQPAVYFLDSHQSGAETGNNGTWVPLLKEVEMILQKNNAKSIYIIDDVRLFDGPWDWKGVTVANILKIFGDRVKDYFVKNDRLVIYT